MENILPPPIALLLFSNDLDNFLPNIRQECKIIEDALEPYHDTYRLRIIIRSSVSILDLFRLFNRYKGRICCLHFAGHASGSGLQLNDEHFYTETGRAEGLASLIRQEVLEGQLQMVFLNGCSTLPQVEGLQKAGVPTIIATSCPINDSKATLFAQQFYRSFANTDSEKPFEGQPITIQQAFDRAVAYLNTSEAFEAETTSRGLFIRRVKQPYSSPWVLFTKNNTWVLPSEINRVELSQNHKRITASKWTMSLEQALSKQNVAIRKSDIFERYGWLIAVFLLKMETKIGKSLTLRRLSFMVEAFQSSLRYLSYVQLSQLMRLKNPPSNLIIQDFLHLSPDRQSTFDYWDLILTTTDLLPKESAFVPEIHDLLTLFYKKGEDFQNTVYFLQKYRSLLLNGKIAEHELNEILEEYLTALVIWLRKIAFLAQYRLVSVKDIQLNYRLGTAKTFIHLYGELHGMYKEKGMGQDEDYTAIAVENDFTYNQSVLLFKGKNVEMALDNIKDNTSYLSLSPFLIDQSVFAEKNKQTPEIYYYAGQKKGDFHFFRYKNELNYELKDNIAANKIMVVEEQNNEQPQLDELFEQIKLLFNTFNA